MKTSGENAGGDLSTRDEPSPEAVAARMSKKHVRGSMVLLAGRFVSLGFTVITQVVIVRALSKTEFGVFAYAFTLVNSGRILLSLGQGKLLSRFMTKYEEEGDYPRMFGSIFLAIGTVLVTSGLLMGALALWAVPLLGSSFDDPRAVHVLLILMFCAPLQALDQVFVSIFAVFSKPQAIFFRKYLFTPALQLTVVILIAALHGTVYQLALGYSVTSAVGIAIYIVLLVRVLRERGISQHFRLSSVAYPVKAVFGFSLPTMTSELVYLATNMGSVIILGASWGARQVASFRAVLPAARLNQVVYQTFVTMFLPMSARLHARGDHTGVRETYWHTSHFLAVTTFPVFIMTSVFAPVTTVTLFGQRYASSGSVLLALSIGYYVSIALGFNIYVLQIYGRLRYLVVSNITVAVACLALALVLTPKYGALGAAVANGATMTGQNIVNQIVLARTMERGGDLLAYLRPYLLIAAVTAVLVVIRVTIDPGLFAAVALTLVASFLVLRMTRSTLKLTHTFPELGRIPLLSKVIG
ncbi:MAG: oligosaccharide flippase family protein [Nocardioidaceae bacterium]